MPNDGYDARRGRETEQMWPSCLIRGWFTFRECGAVSSEGEHGQGDEGGGGVEPECHPGYDADLGAGRFDQPVAELMFQRRFDPGTVPADLAAEFGELRDAASGCP